MCKFAVSIQYMSYFVNTLDTSEYSGYNID